MKRSTNGQDIEDFANEFHKENQLLQSIDIKTKLSENRIASLEDSNKQYFNEIIQLKKDYSILEKICIFELAVILLLIYLMVIVL